MRADLHTHSSASDGRLSPTELVRAASEVGLNVIGITDHDCVDGIDEALQAARTLPHLMVIPGVEISTDVPKGEIHVLGYFLDHHNPELLTALDKLRHSRLLRAQRMVAKLGDLGMPLEWKRVLEIAGNGAIGRPHIAQAMMERGHITSFREAFEKYIGRQGPAYVEREKVTPSQAVELIAESGGLPVLAHPGDIDDLESVVPMLQKVGLVGIEVHYDNYSPKTIARLASLCSRFNLIACGGSDFHGIDQSTETPLGGVNIPVDSVRKLLVLAEKRGQISAARATQGQLAVEKAKVPVEKRNRIIR